MPANHATTDMEQGIVQGLVQGYKLGGKHPAPLFFSELSEGRCRFIIISVIASAVQMTIGRLGGTVLYVA